MYFTISLFVILAAVLLLIGKIADKRAKEYSKYVEPITGGQLVRGMIAGLGGFLLPLLPASYFAFVKPPENPIILILSFALLVVNIIVMAVASCKYHIGNTIAAHCLAYIHAEKEKEFFKSFFLLLPAILFLIIAMWVSQGWIDRNILWGLKRFIDRTLFEIRLIIS